MHGDKLQTDILLASRKKNKWGEAALMALGVLLGYENVLELDLCGGYTAL